MSESPLSQKKYDIVFVSTIFLDDDFEYFSGGAEIHLKNICEVLKPQKKILIIQMSKKYDHHFLQKDGLDVYCIKTTSHFSFLWSARKTLEHVSTKWVHFNDLLLFLLITKKHNTTYSATHHGIGWDFPTTNFPKPYIANTLKYKIGAKVRKLYYSLFEALAVIRLTKVFCVDTSLLRLTQQFLTKHRTKIHLITNFVDTDMFIPTALPSKNDDVVSILYPRNLSFARGIHLLCPLAQYLQNQKLSFVIKLVGAPVTLSATPNSYQEKLQQEIQEKNLERYFEFIGRVKHEDMPEVMQQCDIILIPTFFSEGTSLAALEAMATKKLVIASNIGGLNDILIDGYNGYVTQPDAIRLGDKILYATKHPAEIEKIINRAHDMVQTTFAFTTWSKKVTRFFTD